MRIGALVVALLLAGAGHAASWEQTADGVHSNPPFPKKPALFCSLRFSGASEESRQIVLPEGAGLIHRRFRGF